MATINIPNDPNKNVSTANAAPQQQNPSANSGVQTQSGQFSTLQKYLGANKNAGQRIAGMVGGNLNNETSQLKGTTQREIGESNQANQNFGNLTNQTQGFTQRLYQPATSLNTVNGRAYDVNSYGSNMAGQDAVKDIVNDQNQLQTFTGIRTGDAAAKQKFESDKQASEAMQAASRAYDTNKQRQSQLTSNPGRDQLISQTLNTKNQRAGLRNLDNAFLTQDKSGALNNLSNNLRSDVGTLQQNINQGEQQAGAVADLNQNQLTAQTGLNDRLTGMETEYDGLLGGRIASINEAKVKRKQELQDAFAQLRDTGEAKQGFADMLQLQNVIKANPMDGGGDVGINMGGNLNNKPYDGVRTFETLRGASDVNQFLNTSLLDRKALTGSDTANSTDVENLSRLATLMGKNSSITDASQFTGNQVGESSLDEKLNERALKFQTQDLLKNFSASGRGTEEVMRSGAFGKRRVGEAVGSSSATANLDDYLNQKRIYRSTSAGEQRDDGILSRILSPEKNITDPLGLIREIGSSITNAGPMESEAAAYNRQDQATDNMLNSRQQRDSLLAQSGYDFNRLDGLQSNYSGGGGEQEKAAAAAEAQGLASVKSQADQYMEDIGYKNLLKIIQGDF